MKRTAKITKGLLKKKSVEVAEKKWLTIETHSEIELPVEFENIEDLRKKCDHLFNEVSEQVERNFDAEVRKYKRSQSI